MSRASALWHPGKVPEIRAGFWWHAENATGLGTTGFSVPDGNGSAQAMVQATVASQPTLLNEKNTKAFRMRNAADSNPSLIGTADAFQAGWTGATYVAGWFRLPSGIPTSNGSLFQHNTTTGNQNRVNLALAAGVVNGNVSANGTTVVNNGYSVTEFTGATWCYVEQLFTGSGASNAELLKVFINFSELARTAGSGSITTTILDATAKAGIGCRFQTGAANVDTTDWCVVYYGNGIPKLKHRKMLSRYKPPT